MHSRIHFYLLLISGFLLAGCSASEALYDYDKSADFSVYKTFARKEADSKAAAGKTESPVLNMKFSQALDSVLTEKGYVFDAANPDLLVSYVTSIEFLPSYGTTNFEKWQGAWSKSETSLLVTKGVIIIDIVDTKTNRLIWRGWETEMIGELPKNVPEKIRSVVNTILENFPARRK